MSSQNTEDDTSFSITNPLEPLRVKGLSDEFLESMGFKKETTFSSSLDDLVVQPVFKQITQLPILGLISVQDVPLSPSEEKND